MEAGVIKVDGDIVGGVDGDGKDEGGFVWVERVVGNEMGVVVGGKEFVLGSKRAVEDLIGVAKVIGGGGKGGGRGVVGGMLSVFATSFNMGEVDVGDAGDVEGWLNTHADVVMVGVQELKWGGAAAWKALLDEIFVKGREYVCVGHVVAWDRALTCYVRESLAGVVGMRATDTENVGFVGVGGNKGGIGMRFAVGDTMFAVINSHLAAHQEAVGKRNEDYTEIAAKLQLGDHDGTELLGSVVHYTFWLGDLNYRIDLSRDKVLELIKAREFFTLASNDQLRRSISSGSAFPGFVEGPLQFNPTYRYDRGTRVYAVNRLRIPAWCDRVLCRALQGSNVSVVNYYAADEITTSDHSPVVAEFFVAAQDNPVPRSDDLANESAPRAKLVFSGLKVSLDNLDVLPDTVSDTQDSSTNSISDTSILKQTTSSDEYKAQFRGAVLLENDHRTRFTTSKGDSATVIFGEDELPGMSLVVSDADRVRKRHIVVTLKRRRGSNVGYGEEVVGNAVLWLGSKEETDGKSLAKGPVMIKGLEIGEVQARFEVVLEKCVQDGDHDKDV